MSKTLARVLCVLALLLAGLYASRAEAKFVFNQNHPDLEWYSIRTEHFAVHYARSRKEEGNEHFLSSERAARLTARIAEEMWPLMCGQYGYYLKERVNIVIVNQSDYLEGFTIPQWDWIVISTNPGAYFYRQRGRMEWISDVLVHEFAHVVSLKAAGPFAEGNYGIQAGGLYQDGINDVGTGVQFFFVEGDYHFWTEGNAEGGSDITGYNWWTAARDMNLRATVLQDRVLDVKQLGRLTRPWGWNDWERSYQIGYAFGLYMRQRFGEDIYTRTAIEAGKRWRFKWTTIFEDVVGIPLDTLYDDWKAYVEEKYTAQAEAIRAEGEVAGMELVDSRKEWMFKTPSQRESWKDKSYYERWEEREATGTWLMEPRYDAEHQIFGVNNRGRVALVHYPIDRHVAFTGHYPSNPEWMEIMGRESSLLPADFMHGWDFIPGQRSVVVTGTEHHNPSKFSKLTGARVEHDGYDWKQLWVLDIVEREEKKKGLSFETWQRKRLVNGRGVFEKGAARPIPNTLRGSDPAMHPGGERVAYLQYHDGTLNLATINLDGSDKRLLTNFDDGTWMQRPMWSPDGSKIVVSMFKDYQQNLYLVDAESGDIQALTWDGWEEQDAYWTDNDRIYFSADPDGVYNIFYYDLATDRVVQVTNVVTGAECPLITPEGNLVYQHYDAFGWKTYGLARADFYERDVTHLFGTSPDQEEVDQLLAYSEDLSEYEAMTEPYSSFRSLVPPYGYPMFRFENDTMTNFGFSGGFWAELMDYVEYHRFSLYSILGEDNFVRGLYGNSMWYPNLYVMAYTWRGKSDYGYWLDLDERESTTEDQYTFENKRNVYQNAAMMMVEYPWSDRYYTYFWLYPWEYGLRGSDADEWQPYMREIEAGLDLGFSNNSYDYYSPNPRAGRNVSLTYTHGWTDIVYEEYGGVSVDDGELLDAYHYNRYEMRWTEQLDIPTLWGNGILAKAREKDHRIQLDLRLGYVDRNVSLNDEFTAGGQHPYDWGIGSLRPNTLFAGYPYWSLFGETMAIMNAMYRFPLHHNIKYRVGPLYVGSAYMQFGATAGNLWSYRPPEDTDKLYYSRYDERIAYDPDDIVREIPFVDEAYKNGNRMLYDAQVEFRLASTLFSYPWNSFLRLAYGFNEIRGIGDVDGDDIWDTSENAFGDELSNETEPAGFRTYIGFGTGW